MQAEVDQKVLDDAELIALVRQAQDQFEAYGELNACCASRKLPGSLDQSGLTSLKQRLLAKGRVRAVNGVEPARIEFGHIGKTSYSDGVFPSRKQMKIFDSGEENSNEIQDKAVSGKTGAAGGLLRKRRP
jgi:hypothetical protein